jgi:hypothetical protein
MWRMECAPNDRRLQAGNVTQARAAESSTTRFVTLGKLFVFANKMSDSQAENILTEAIFHRAEQFVNARVGDPCSELAKMVTMIWGVAAPDAPVRRLLGDIFVFYEWRRKRNETRRVHEMRELYKCLRSTPTDFLARVVTTLLEHREKPNGRCFKLENYHQATVGRSDSGMTILGQTSVTVSCLGRG